MNEDRYPYTYACDMLREICSKLSRYEASKIRQLFANILDINDEELANKLADHYVNGLHKEFNYDS